MKLFISILTVLSLLAIAPQVGGKAFLGFLAGGAAICALAVRE